MALIPEQFIGAVLSIGIRTGSNIKWIGTEFFIVKNLGENRYQPMMITNKHVLNGHSNIVIRLRKKNSGQLVVIDMPIKNENGELYSVHPDDKVDVAAVLLNAGDVYEGELMDKANEIEHEYLTKHKETIPEIIENAR